MNNKKELAAKLAHQKFLNKMGVKPLSNKKQKRNLAKVKVGYAASYYEDKPLNQLCAMGGPATGLNNGIMANLHKETPDVQAKILAKARRTGTTAHKGGSGYITDEMDLTSLTRK